MILHTSLTGDIGWRTSVRQLVLIDIGIRIEGAEVVKVGVNPAGWRRGGAHVDVHPVTVVVVGAVFEAVRGGHHAVCRHPLCADRMDAVPGYPVRLAR